MQGQESCELKQEEEATQCVDFTDESLHESDSNDNNMDDDDDAGGDFCAVCEGYFYAKYCPKCDRIHCVSCILAEYRLQL
jgi:hypothetical protein